MDGRTPDGPAAPADRERDLAEVILVGSRRAGLGPGSRLPTEQQLAAGLGTSRNAVRRALALLQAQGHLSREVGRGTFLRAGPGPAPGEPGAAGGDGFAPADVMVVRRLLQPPAMRLVVAWATAADLREIGGCLIGADAATCYEEFETWDRALQRAIMAAAHSPLLTRLQIVIDEAGLPGGLRRHLACRQRYREYLADRRDLVEALLARDAGRAVESMRAHLSRLSGHLFGDGQ